MCHKNEIFLHTKVIDVPDLGSAEFSAPGMTHILPQAIISVNSLEFTCSRLTLGLRKQQ